MPKISYVENENTDRDFPDAFEITEAELKINGEYICFEPCGSGSAEHALGDIYIYVTGGGDDRYPEEGEAPRVGSIDDPFASIERAFEYINAIVTIEGDIYIRLGSGTFYINDTIRINHPNKIIIVSDLGGDYYFSDSIQFTDYCFAEFLYLWFGSVGFIGGGYSTYADIRKFTISIESDSVHFGDLTQGRYLLAACGGGSIGVFGGGYVASTYQDIIDKIVFAIDADATDFGDLSLARHGLASCADGTIGVFGGGFHNVGIIVIDKIIVAVSSDVTYFGDLSVAKYYNDAVSDGTTGIFIGGALDVMDYITFSSESHAIDFGNITYSGAIGISACANETTAIFIGGGETKELEKITMAIKANSTIFGNYSSTGIFSGSCSDGTYGVFALESEMERINIASETTTSYFGEQIPPTKQMGACSGN